MHCTAPQLYYYLTVHFWACILIYLYQLSASLMKFASSDNVKVHSNDSKGRLVAKELFYSVTLYLLNLNLSRQYFSDLNLYFVNSHLLH